MSGLIDLVNKGAVSLQGLADGTTKIVWDQVAIAALAGGVTSIGGYKLYTWLAKKPGVVKVIKRMKFWGKKSV